MTVEKKLVISEVLEGMTRFRQTTGGTVVLLATCQPRAFLTPFVEMAGDTPAWTIIPNLVFPHFKASRIHPNLFLVKHYICWQCTGAEI